MIGFVIIFREFPPILVVRFTAFSGEPIRAGEMRILPFHWSTSLAPELSFFAVEMELKEALGVWK